VAFLEKRKGMVTVRVKGGTPAGKDNLCRKCSRVHIIKGFSAMEEEVFCRIRFVVSECTFYEDKGLASKEDMEQIAWFLTTQKAGRSVGFVSALSFQELEQGGEESSRSPQRNRRNDGVTAEAGRACRQLKRKTLERRSHDSD
jgi:hypothetical protein